MLSNDVTTAPCQALLLTPKSRVIAPVVIVRRAEDDFLLLTEPGLGETVASTLVRARFAAKVEIEPEEHTSVVVFGERDGIPTAEFGEASSELLDADVEPTLSAEELEQLRIEAGMPAWGKEIDDSILPGRGGPRRDAHLVHEGLLPGSGADRQASQSRQGQPSAPRARGRGRRSRVTRSASATRRSAE